MHVYYKKINQIPQWNLDKFIGIKFKSFLLIHFCDLMNIILIPFANQSFWNACEYNDFDRVMLKEKFCHFIEIKCNKLQ